MAIKDFKVKNGLETPALKITGLGSVTVTGYLTRDSSGVVGTTATIPNTGLLNSSVTIGSTNIALGATQTTLAGLTSVTSTTFVGALTGNATTATTLQTPRNINGVSFNGSADITVTAAAGTLTGTTLASGVVNSSLTKIGLSSAGFVKTDASGNLTVDANAYSTTAHTHNYAGSASAGGPASSIANSMTVKFDTGVTEGTDLYTFSGSAAKTIDIKAGSNVTITKAAGSATIAVANANWDTAYTDRNKWDGGATGLVAATGRTSLGATTVGSNLFTLTNPGAITFIRLNADNSVSALDAASFRTAIGAGTSSTTGTVTSVALSMPAIFSVSGSPVTTTGTLTASLATQTANTVFAGPSSGGAVAPTFRALVDDDIPNVLTGTTYNGLTLTAAATGFTIAGGTASKTLTVQNTMTLLAADDTTQVNFGNPTGAVAYATANSDTAVAADRGGTGNWTYTIGDILYASGTTALSKLAAVATGNALISGGTGTAPSWGKIGLTTHVSGTLPIANGGTNSTATPTDGGIAFGNGTAYAFTAAGTSGQILQSAGTGDPVWAWAPLVNINAQTGTSYTLVIGDAGKMVEMNNAAANTFYVPTDASVNFPIGTQITVLQTGSGQTTIAAVTPGTTTVNGTPGLKLRASWSSATLIKRAANTWVAIGDLSA